VNANRHDPAGIAAIKGSLRMARVLGRAARDAVPGSPDRLRVLYRGQLLELDRRALDEARRAVLAQGVRRNAVRAKAAGYVLDALWRQSVELLAPQRRQAREDFAAEIAERREFVQFMGRWWPILTPLDVLGWFADARRARRYAEGILSRTELDRLATSFAGFAADGPTVADVALLDELDELLGTVPVRARPRRDPFQVAAGVREVTTYADRMAAARAVATERPDDYRDYAHVVVDEAQDVSPMQWRMVGRRGRHASWTIVGDPAQAAWSDTAEASRAMDAALGSRRRHEYTLNTNYRNAAEIFELAAAVIRRAEPDLELPTAVRTSGVPPVNRVVIAGALADATRTAVAEVLSGVAGTVGVITRMADRDEAAGWLAGAEFADERLQVVGSLEAKGMEYDGVVVVEPAAIGAEGRSGVRTLYVALSRATQRLVTVGTDDSWRPGATC
jgi:UvrD-like helicase C-terminal domain/AAA domain